jgi:hypothetical protein
VTENQSQPHWLKKMSCNRGQANPDQQTRLRLFADSGGYCQRPECSNRLFVDTGSKNIHLAEMAHIIAAGGAGPRSNAAVTQKEKGVYDNLILLCANCHTTVDKAPADFPDTLLKEWKRKHVERIAGLFGAVVYADRASARKAIEPALTENRAIFEKYGPNNDYRENPESEVARVWQRKMRAIILPNNRKILTIIDANQHHLTLGEIQTLEAFRQHVDDLEAKHVGDNSGDVATRFPSGMSGILLDTHMTRRAPTETIKWVADNLRKAERVSGVEVLSDQILRVSRCKYDPFVAGIVSQPRVESDEIRSIVKSQFGVEIIANVPKEGFWTGSALRLAQDHAIATGTLGDLYRVIDLENVRAFLQRETIFVERGLRQHNRIASFEQVHDRLYRIKRNGLPDLTVVMLNEYELTGDHLRTAHDRYGKFSLAVITNPNGGATSKAEEVAETMGAEVLKWGPFFGRLNRK